MSIPKAGPQAPGRGRGDHVVTAAMLRDRTDTQAPPPAAPNAAPPDEGGEAGPPDRGLDALGRQVPGQRPGRVLAVRVRVMNQPAEPRRVRRGPAAAVRSAAER